MKKQINKRGFTLIELLVTITIIGILTSIVMSTFATARSKSRDAKRISDLAQIQLALELLFDRCNGYPPGGTLNLASGVSGCSSYTLATFISVMPTDPNSSTPYVYATNGGSNTDYVLRATLENSNSLPAGDINGSPYSTPCDSNYYCVQPK